MGKASRDKGARFERAVVQALTEYGIDANRVPLSGAVDGYPGDVLVRPHWADQPLTLECKSRASGFKFLYENLADNDALVVKADRQEPLVVVRLSTYAELLQ